MDKLRCMEVFVNVVDAGNFTLAGHRLGITTVRVGRQIRELEALLGTRLLNRNTRTQSLTDAGALYYRSARTILENVMRAQEAVQDIGGQAGGKLRISAPVSLGSCLVAPMLTAYQREFPHMAIELVLSNAKVNLLDEGFDLAIRVGSLPDSGLVARPMRPYRSRICAAPAYLAHAGLPLDWADLQQHRCLGHLDWRAQWTSKDGSDMTWPAQPVFMANDGFALRAAAIAGAGLILQPEVLLAEAIDRGELVTVLDDFLPPPLPVHLLYLQDPYPRPRLAQLVEFLLARLG